MVIFFLFVPPFDKFPQIDVVILKWHNQKTSVLVGVCMYAHVEACFLNMLALGHTFHLHQDKKMTFSNI